MGTETFLRVGIDGTGAQEGERVVKRSLDSISQAAVSTDSSLNLMKKTLYGIGAGAAGLYGLANAIQAIRNVTHDVLKYLGSLETSVLGIGSAFLTGGRYVDALTGKTVEGQRAMRVAMSDAQKVIDELRVANLQTIATLEQLVHAYQETLPVATAKGFNRQQVKDFTVAMVQAAGVVDSTGQLLYRLGEETRSLLTGRIMPGQSRIAQVLGLRPEDIRQFQGNAQGLFDFLMERLNGFRLSGIESQKTWLGLWSNMKDISQQLGGVALAPVFEGVKKVLSDVQKALFTIDEKTQSIKFNAVFEEQAKSIGRSLKDFFNSLVSGAQFLYEHAEAIKNIALAYAGYKLTMMASAAAQAFYNAELWKTIAAHNASLSSNVAMTKTTANETAVSAINAKVKLENAEATRLSMFAEREHYAAKVQAVAADEALVVADMKVAESKAVSIMMKKEERLATLENLQAKIAEEAFAAQNVKTGPFAAARLAVLKKEEANVRRSVAMLTKMETAAIAENTAATEVANAATARRVVMENELAAAEARYITSSGMATAATIANTTATKAATLAANEQSLALYNASLSGRIYTGVVNGLKAALTFMGGPIGLIVTLLGLAATAWYIFGNKAEEANKKAAESADDYVKQLDDQVKKLNERNRLLDYDKKTPDQKKQDTLGGLTDSDLTQLESLRRLKADLELKKEVQYGFLSEKDEKVLVKYNTQMQEIIEKRKQLQFIEKEDAGTKYDARPPVIDDKDGAELEKYREQLLRAHEQYMQYSKAFDERVLAEIKNYTKYELDALNARNELKLLSQQQYIQDSYNLEKAASEAELVQIQQRFDDAAKFLKQAREANKNAVGKNEKGELLYDPALLKTEVEAETEYQNVLKERNNILGKLENDGQKFHLSTMKNTKALTQQWQELSAAIKEAQGNFVEATIDLEKYKQSELENQRNAIMANGPVEINSAQEILNINKQIEQSKFNVLKVMYKEVEIQTELRAQLLEQANLSGQAAALRDSIKPMDPSKLGLDTVTKSLEKMNDALKRVVASFNELHRNDEIKFRKEDLGVDPFTKRERDIQREYRRTYELKSNLLKEYMKDEKGNASAIKNIQEDLAAADGERQTQLTQLKKDMTLQYVQTAGDLMGQLSSIMDTENRSQFEAAKALNVGQAIMNTAGAIMQAMSTLPPPASYAAAAVAAAVGAVQVAKIMSTSFGGTGSVAGFTASGSYSSGSNATTGSRIGGAIKPTQELATPFLDKVASSMENASVALTKVANSLVNISDFFSSDRVKLMFGDMSSSINNAEDKWKFNSSDMFNPNNLWTQKGNFFENGWNFAMRNDPVTSFLMNGFFGGDTEMTGSGLALRLNQGRTKGYQYTTYHEDGGWFGGDSDWTDYSNVPRTFQNSLNTITDSIISNIQRSAVMLGTTANVGKAELSEVRISTAGRTDEDILKDLEAWFVKASAAIAKTTEGLQEFTYPGENAYEALMRLTTSLQGVNTSLALIDHTLINSTLGGANQAYRITELLGGTEKFQDAVGEYFSTVFTDFEQATLKQKDSTRIMTNSINEMNLAFSGLNWSVPKTNQEFVALVNSLDLSTDKGASLFASLMSLVPTMGDFTDSLKTLQDVVNQNRDIGVRGIAATGIAEMADILSIIIGYEDELVSARETGLDMAQLELVQRQELNKQLKDQYKSAADNYYQAQQDYNATLIESANTLLTSSKSLAEGWKKVNEDITKTKQQLLIGNQTILSPEAQLGTAKSFVMDAYNKGIAGDQNALAGLPNTVTQYMNLAKQYYASSVAYADEFALMNNILDASAGYAQGQVNYAEATAAIQQNILDTLQKSDEQRKKEAQEQAALIMAQNKVLMEGFQRLIAEAEKQGISLTELETIARREAMNG